VLFTTKYSLNLRVISAWIEYYTKTAEHKLLASGYHKQKNTGELEKNALATLPCKFF